MKPALPDPLTLEASPAGLWNMANILTMVRLLLVPFFGFLLAHDHGRSAAWRAMACAEIGRAHV